MKINYLLIIMILVVVCCCGCTNSEDVVLNDVTITDKQIDKGYRYLETNCGTFMCIDINLYSNLLIGNTYDLVYCKYNNNNYRVIVKQL